MLSKLMTVFALLVISCATVQPGNEASSSESSGLGEVKASIQIASGVDITQIAYTLACTPTPVPSQVATGTWQVEANFNGVAKVNGSIGGLDPNDTCTLVLSAQDSWGLANGNIQNCRGEADSIPVGGSTVQMNLVCTDNSVAGPNSGNVTANITVQQGAPYQCSRIAWYSSAESHSPTQYVGSTFALNMAVTVPTSPQTVTWTSTDGAAYFYQGATYANVFTLTGDQATDPITSSGSPAAQVMLCYTSGDFAITLTVQDLTPGLLINGQPGLCPAYSNTFAITCY
jgi:hypothetical protein